MYKVAIAKNIKKSWVSSELAWNDFTHMFENPTVLNVDDFSSLDADAKNELKMSAGGYFAGELTSSQRRKSSVKSRSMLVLDLDFARPDFWDRYRLMVGTKALAHTTFSHTNDNWKVRLILPTNREMTTNEYQAVSRKVAEQVGMQYFDDVSFRPTQLAYFPVVTDIDNYNTWICDGEVLQVDRILNLYENWENIAEWAGVAKPVVSGGRRKATEIGGIVGLFNKTYTVSQAIEKFIPEIYVPTDVENRWTYALGSQTGGLLIYDNDTLAYSYHSSDPLSDGHEHTAFDVVRVHQFGSFDNPTVDFTKRFSYIQMCEIAANDEKVRLKKSEQAKLDFEKFNEVSEDRTGKELIVSIDDDIKTLEKIFEHGEINKKTGELKPTIRNFALIFKYDKRLNDLFVDNVFSGMQEIRIPNFWSNDLDPRLLGRKTKYISNIDISTIRSYIETRYKIRNVGKLEDIINIEFNKNKINPPADYIKKCAEKWDGVARLDTVFCDVLGVENTEYSRKVCGRFFMGACKRVVEPACKFDIVPVLIGTQQGEGKSTFVQKFAKHWASDTLQNMKDKSALEQIRGKWIVEIAEMSAMKNSEIETVKHFLTKQVDSYRPAYGRNLQDYLRTCVFIATTNDYRFLRDITGNRRFWPLVTNPKKSKYPVWNLDENYIDQIWGEAYTRMMKGEKIFFDRQEELEYKGIKDKHALHDITFSIIESKLDVKVPENWDGWWLADRMHYYENLTLQKEQGVKLLDTICIAQIWCEILGKDKSNLTKFKAKTIGQQLVQTGKWKRSDKTIKTKIYGRQRTFTRI